jgi:hypothetical protein
MLACGSFVNVGTGTVLTRMELNNMAPVVSGECAAKGNLRFVDTFGNRDVYI